MADNRLEANVIRKTQRNFRRQVKSGIPGSTYGYHNEIVLRETWWLLFIPLYSREVIQRTNL